MCMTDWVDAKTSKNLISIFYTVSKVWPAYNGMDTHSVPGSDDRWCVSAVILSKSTWDSIFLYTVKADERDVRPLRCRYQDRAS